MKNINYILIKLKKHKRKLQNKIWQLKNKKIKINMINKLILIKNKKKLINCKIKFKIYLKNNSKLS